MRRLIVAALMLSAAGCGSTAQLAFAPRQPKGIDQSVVERLVCEGNIEKAETYIYDRQGSRAEITESITRAKEKVAHMEGCK